jgi:hypothetical protein
MRHEMLTQRALFCIDVMAKRVTLSQHFVTRVVPPLTTDRGSQNLRKHYMEGSDHYSHTTEFTQLHNLPYFPY